MKKLIFNISICVALMVVSLVVAWVAPGTHPHDLAALVNKKEMLATKPHPRMIFVGGSSVLTLKSPLIEKELHYSVINMSLWGGLGTREHLDEIEAFIQPGDIVVVTMEYATILDEKYYEYIHVNDEAKKFFFLMSPDRHIRQYIQDRQFFSMLKIMHELCQMKFKSYLRNIATGNFAHLFDRGFPNYNEEFNSFGDRAKPYNIFRPLANSDHTFSIPKWDHLEFLNRFHDFALKRKARIFFYFSHFPDEQYKLNKKYIDSYYQLMTSNFKGVIINTPSDFVYPDEYFGDTIYHLNDKGETVRSAELIKMLKKVL
jgi:hypothetical protein